MQKVVTRVSLSRMDATIWHTSERSRGNPNVLTPCRATSPRSTKIEIDTRFRLRDPGIAPAPKAPFDTFIGRGVGACNGLPAAIDFILTDAGESGTDTAAYQITGACTLTAGPALLDNGNHQAHKI